MGTGQKPEPLPRGHPMYPKVVRMAIEALASDEVAVVRDTAAWALTNIFISNAVPLLTSFSTSSIETPLSDFPELQEQLVEAVIARVDDTEALVSSNCCGILINMAISFASPLPLLEVTQTKLAATLTRAIDDLSVLSAALDEASAARAGASSSSTPRPGGVATPKSLLTPGTGSSASSRTFETALDAALEPTVAEQRLERALALVASVSGETVQAMSSTFGSAAPAVPEGYEAIRQAAYMRVFDAAAAASALFSLWYEVLESSNSNLMNPYFDPVEDRLVVDPAVVEQIEGVAAHLISLLFRGNLPAVRMSDETSPVSHRSRFAHVVGRIEFMSNTDGNGKCRFCSAAHEPPLADVRAFVLHALGPIVPLLLQSQRSIDVVCDLVDYVADVLEEDDINDSVHIAKAEASLVFSFAISILSSMPDLERELAPVCERVVDALSGPGLPELCYPVWQRCVQLLGSLAHHTADHLAPQFDEVVSRIISSAEHFLSHGEEHTHAGACALLTAEQSENMCGCNSPLSVAIAALCLADMVFIVADHMTENGRLETIFNFVLRVLKSAPAPDTPVDRSLESSCCAEHAAEAAAHAEKVAAAKRAVLSGPLADYESPFWTTVADSYTYFANLEAFFFSARSIVHFAVPEGGPVPGEFEPYARTILEHIRDSSPFLCPTRSAAIMAEAAALVGQLVTSYPVLATLATHNDIFDMVSVLVVYNRDTNEDSIAADFAEDTYAVLTEIKEAQARALDLAAGGFGPAVFEMLQALLPHGHWG
ncbi:uncharacterized protein AMSG_09078 [Thecamonas trahens ATCC 50062]|uniref:Uncharacterized protein n=1 Tax=Thecamonas trahens ATCC 50062 TaxID=461836 RepID=A0A0L0DKL1_THETB|nr:hypothetical protein AMSG_09078 [Thecamonas trahens ATCC 50062]KNC52914.1 hypothetical protein AMSG_09078 [Thecamonas trahens ATCC 50062]|eukprot:XP_013754811.1 hypothetical protein AMSG_09078 [Thecamonas trahens ATCC 50062]